MGSVRYRWSRAVIVGLGGAVGLLVVVGGSVVAEDPIDTTPPSGTFWVNDGSGLANSPTLTLHVPATDDVGVVAVQVSEEGNNHDLVPYAETIEHTLTDTGDHAYSLQVQWFDAAGNGMWSDGATVTLDRQAPVIGTIGWLDWPEEADDVRSVSVSSGDGWPISHVRLSSDGSNWSPDIPWSEVIDWHYLDPVQGGSPVLGVRTLYVKARDAAGNWSATATKPTVAAPAAPLEVAPGVPVTGQVITLTPQFPAPVTFPTGTRCMWEVMWGNERSLYWGERDDTFGFMHLYGGQGAGYCRPLSFTLPWIKYPRMMVSYRVELPDTETSIDSSIGSSPEEPAIEPVIDSTSRHITWSSTPLVYVLPDDYTLVLGVPTTYRAYAVAGARITDDDLWSVGYIDNPLQKWGGTSFTFTPAQTGYLTVCWGTDSTRNTRWSACYDPPVRRKDRYRPNTSAPVQRIGTGTLGDRVPVALTWDGSDRGWGIDRYQLERSVDGGAWRRLLSAKVKTYATTLETGHRYRYRVRAIDRYGNVGYWDYGPSFRPRKVGDGSASITYAGAWSVTADPTAHGGALHETDAAGTRARFEFTGRDVAWVAERGPGHGRASVYVDGTLVRMVDLEAASDEPARIVFRRHWSATGDHVLRIVVEGTAGRPTVGVDGFVMLR